MLVEARALCDSGAAATGADKEEGNCCETDMPAEGDADEGTGDGENDGDVGECVALVTTAGADDDSDFEVDELCLEELDS